MRETLAFPVDVTATPSASSARPVPPPSPGPRPKAAGWDVLLVCVAVYVATSVGRVHQLFPVLMPLKIAFLASVVALVLYMLQQSGPRSVVRLPSRTTMCLLGLLAWAALSVPTALSQGVAFYAWTDLARTVVMCLVLAGAVRSTRDLERLILVYFGATVLYTAIVLSRFELGANNWRLADLYHYDANDLATLIASAMPMGLYFVLAQRRLLMRLLATGGLVILAVGLIRSGSRGGFLAGLAMVAFVLLGFTTIPARSRLAGLIVIVAITFATATDRYWTQMQTIIHPNDDYNLTSDGGRMKVWKRGIGYMMDHPVSGVGLSNFPRAEGTLSPAARRQRPGVGVHWGAAHNSFIQVGAETGVPGVLLFITVIASAMMGLRRVARRALRASPPARDVSRLAQTLTATLIAFVVGAFFLSLAYSDMLYTLIAFAIGLQKISRPNKKIAHLSPTPTPVG